MLKSFLGRSLGATLVVLNLTLAGCAAVSPGPAVGPTVLPIAAATVAAAQPTARPSRPAAQPAAAAEPPAAAPVAAEVAVVGVRVLRNALGQALIAGVVVNNNAIPISDIELTVTASDAAGDTLIKDDWSGELVEAATVAPLTPAIAPGEAVPFVYRIYEGEPAEFAVALRGYEPFDAAPPQVVALENGQIVTDIFGEQHLLGEVVNTAHVPQSIQSLHAVIYDAGGELLAVEDADILVRQLDAAGGAADSAPISISLGELPGEPASYTIYATVAEAEPAAAGVRFSDSFHSYFDQAGGLHLVGMVGNPTAAPVSADLTAGLYDADGVVLDRSGGGLYWLRLPAGASVPYDFSDFSLVETLPELAGRVDHYTVQVDPQYTRFEDAADVAISSEGDTLAAGADGWEVSGAVVNSADQTMGRVVVIAALHDAEGNPLVVGSRVLDSFTGEGLAAGQGADYNITLDADPGLDPAALTLKTYVYATPAQ